MNVDIKMPLLNRIHSELGQCLGSEDIHYINSNIHAVYGLRFYSVLFWGLEFIVELIWELGSQIDP